MLEMVVGGLVGCFVAWHLARILNEPKRTGIFRPREGDDDEG